MSNTRPLESPPKIKGRPRGFDRKQALISALDVFWHRGYEPASVSELCAAMGVNPPSLYAAFGNKAKLFLEAVDFYQRTYWDAPCERLEATPDVHKAIRAFFQEAASILLSPQAPCGCLVVLAAINVSPDSAEVSEAIKVLRQEGKDLFFRRLMRAVKEGQLPSSTDVKSLSSALKAMLEGMSIQARDGLTLSEMTKLAANAARLLPDPGA